MLTPGNTAKQEMRHAHEKRQCVVVVVVDDAVVERRLPNFVFTVISPTKLVDEPESGPKIIVSIK